MQTLGRSRSATAKKAGIEEMKSRPPQDEEGSAAADREREN